MEKENTIMGFVEVNGNIKKITSITEFKKVLNLLNKEYSEEYIYEKLGSLGMAAFVELYPYLKCNSEMETSILKKIFSKRRISNNNSKSGDWTDKSFAVRVSISRGIIRDGFDKETLKIIAKSSNVDSFFCDLAKEYLHS